ncbi:hypothetical protein [Paenibacillus sp. YN15]|uniref:hypothetical protein n=1 Tax=Paenibacillus sp. YN15 TaxID=1742774 RepID=UPI000DCD76D6|nr:hypothetical protein [Paenibacillus sp. YN15]RAV05141.1 hypothetical protein DQG13_04510 [Paenibacillus sp. YN15]
MELPTWFQSAMEQRMLEVLARIERHTELRFSRAEEEEAWKVLFAGTDKAHSPEFMDWEDKHHFRRAMESEMLYVQGMRDGVQLIVALLNEASEHDAEPGDN